MKSDDNKQKYRVFYKTQDSLPVFFDPEWLDIVCKNGQWDVALKCDHSGRIIAVLPYYIIKKYLNDVIVMPPLTPFGGIAILDNSSQKTETQTKSKRKIIISLIDQIPKTVAYYSQSFYYNFDNWLPYYWKKYDQTTRYSFIIPDLLPWQIENVSTNIRGKIKKAERFLSIKQIDDPKIVFHLYNQLLLQKGITFALSEDSFYQLDAYLKSKEKRMILAAINENGEPVTCIYLVHDQQKTYSLIICSDPVYRHLGSVPFVIYHAIMQSKLYSISFDFEGSMLESMFDLFAGFGGEMKPYYRIYKAKNIFWDIAYRIKNYYVKNIR